MEAKLAQRVDENTEKIRSLEEKLEKLERLLEVR